MVIYGYLGPEIWFRFGYVKLLGNQVNFSGKKKKKPQQELDFDMKALKQLLHSMKWHHNWKKAENKINSPEKSGV